ncbi:Diacylglycerol acyltransferase [Corchorus olitorius]|uniref:Diacylglycerol acyltransferase n=1 Tax=Corchorus olitorius TaxID=93759 RepID=A0A1R3JVN6_9ROSI|nr:Diacylglycerol acyltransferase [Corchorus olitorius]
MASAFTFRVSPCFGINSKFKPRFRVRAERLNGTDLSVLSSDGVSLLVNGASSVIGEKEKKRSLIDGGNGSLKPKIGKKLVKELVSEEMDVLWDDGYGTNTVKDYLESAKDMIKPDGGPPRWFCPVECGNPVKGSPPLLFLPGLDGVGMGLILHHKALGKVFAVQCLHIPVYDRTPFEGLVKIVEETIRLQHASHPNGPIYVVGDSFGGCLALAVAARNPNIDLVLVLVNPATSFVRSQLQPLFPILKAYPEEFHVTIPYLLSLVMGDPVKMATVGIEGRHPPTRKIEQLSGNLTALLPLLSGLADIVPKETLVWKLNLLKSASGYANSRLHAVKAEEENLSLLTVMKGTSKYRRSKRHDYISDFVPPSMSEFRYAFDDVAGLLRIATCCAMFSTMENGTIVEGLSGVPDQGPVLFVGYHMLLGIELSCLIEAFLREKNIMVRGIAHPELFWGKLRSTSDNDFSFSDWVKVMGALPVGANYLFRALSTNSHVLLYPGGAREALHNKGEQYKLFWPDQPEFVRMAARFGATIVPFGTVGEDDVTQLVLDYHDLKKIPMLKDYMTQANRESIKIRDETKGEVANQELFIPGLLPKLPGRFYYLFGKPIKLKGREDLVENRENANELYLHVKSEVEQCIAYLLKKREEDPYRNIIDRTIYRALYSPLDQVPSFKP